MELSIIDHKDKESYSDERTNNWNLYFWYHISFSFGMGIDITQVTLLP